MTRPSLMRVPQAIAVVTLGAGAALLVAPRPMAAAMRLGDRPTLAQVIGVMDLALVPGLLRGRPRWPWVLARAAFNVPVAVAYRTEARRPGGQPAAVGGMVAMLGLTAMDTATAIALRKAEGGAGSV